jgi:hypothetical protein
MTTRTADTRGEDGGRGIGRNISKLNRTKRRSSPSFSLTHARPPSVFRSISKTPGGILGADGCVYAPPYAATGVLRIDPRTDSVDVIGDFPPGGYKWHGGLLAKSTGVVYAFPSHADAVLRIDTNPRPPAGRVVGGGGGDVSWRGSPIPIRRHDGDVDAPDLRYKWRECQFRPPSVSDRDNLFAVV